MKKPLRNNKRYGYNPKKAEVASQIFIYILGIIVVGLLLLLGYKALTDLNKKKCDIQDVQFQTDLKAAIEKNKGRGVSRIESFTLPCGASEVCFVDRTITDALPNAANPSATTPLSTVPAKFSVIVYSVLSGDDTNVFIKTSKGYEPAGLLSASPIETPTTTPIVCVTGDPFKVRFLGKGRTVEPQQP